VTFIPSVVLVFMRAAVLHGASAAALRLHGATAEPVPLVGAPAAPAFLHGTSP
jgi:hypothetical protein